MEEQRKPNKIKVFALIMGAMCMIIGAGIVLTLPSSQPCYDPVFEETQLTTQGFCESCDGCYCFEGVVRDCQPESHMACLFKNEMVKYEFGLEFEHARYPNNSILELQWCLTDYGHRIRNIEVVE